MTEAGALRAEIASLAARRQRGELDERRFERRYAEKTLELYRAVIRQRLRSDERIDREHHVVHAHMKLSQSVLKEPEQQAVSLFLTTARLLRLRSEIVPGRTVTCDDRDRTVIDEVPLERISGLLVRRQVRWGEAATGALICVAAVLGRAWLAITAPFLLLLGAAGVVHALALPTRWAAVVTKEATSSDPILIHGLGRKSGRALARALRAHLVAAVGE